MMYSNLTILLLLLVVVMRSSTTTVAAFEFCHLCGTGSDEGFLPDNPILGLPPPYDIIDTCAMLNATAASFIIQDSPECDQVQGYATYCGCQVHENPCQICSNGEAMDPSYKDTEISFLRFGDAPISCEMYAAYAALFDENDDTCRDLQAFGSACGCPPKENYCEFCPGERVSPEYLDTTLGFLDFLSDGESDTMIGEGVSVVNSCDFLEKSLMQVDSDDFGMCTVSQIFSYLCGCNDGFRVIMGAKTKQQRTIALAVPRVSATLSLLGSLAILYHILKVRRSGRRQQSQTTTGGRYDTFFFVMMPLAVCDISNSVAWIIGPAATPSHMNGDDPGVPGAIGNMFTCRVQSWLIHFGYGCCLYTVSLAMYYKLKIVNGWKEEQLIKARKYLIGCPLVGATALAVAAMPQTVAYPQCCTVSLYPLEENWTNAIVFCILPVGISTITIVGVMIQIFLKVRQVSRISLLDGSRSSRNVSLERKTLWVVALYVFAFLITWPMSTWLLLWAVSSIYAPFGVYVAGLIVTPMQGLSNAIIYFSNQSNWSRCGRKAVQEPQDAENADSSSELPPQSSTSEDQIGKSKMIAAAMDVLDPRCPGDSTQNGDDDTATAEGLSTGNPTGSTSSRSRRRSDLFGSQMIELANRPTEMYASSAHRPARLFGS